MTKMENFDLAPFLETNTNDIGLELDVVLNSKVALDRMTGEGEGEVAVFSAKRWDRISSYS